MHYNLYLEDLHFTFLHLSEQVSTMLHFVTVKTAGADPGILVRGGRDFFF